ncbi:MAG TPA: cell division protein FtsA [Bacteroidetes bacterium]|nr:cell division protein FtsA [Bacteroidota bacterium]
MNQSDIIVGLDIGTTKICAIVGRVNEHGKIDVLGMGKTESFGVERGVVRNLNHTTEAIKRVISEAEEKSGMQIKEVYVGIAGQHIKSLQHRGIRVRENSQEEISHDDIDKMIEDMHKLALQPGEKIIHVLPEEYIVDNEPGFKNPVGMTGARLEANFHVITGQVLHIQNIYRCVKKAGLEVADLVLEPLASSEAVLTEEEKEAGVALVDIGGGTTDIAIFQEGILRHTAVIPLGGNIITEDIKEGCTLMKKQAEMLKVKFGSALALESQQNEIVAIPGLKGREPREITIKNLAHIIQARVTEMIEHVYYEIRCSGYESKLIGGIVITGGGGQLKHLNHLVQYVTGIDSRTGYPTEHIGEAPEEELKNPMYATGMGLIMIGYEDKNVKRIVHLKDQDEETKKPVTTNTVNKPKGKEREKKPFSIINNWFATIKDGLLEEDESL